MGKRWGWLTGLLELFLESKCPLCQRSSSQVLCVDCHRRVLQCQLNPLTRQSTNPFNHPAKNQPEACQQPLPVFAWGVYGGALKQAIAALKYNHQPQLAQPLGHELAKAWMNSPMSRQKSLTVVPIPMHPDKQKQRGFNQAELLAEAFCQGTGLTLQRQGLARIRATEAQFSLSPTAREQNLVEAFALGKDFALRRPTGLVVLLDDIYTTGATARAAVQVLSRHHIPVYGLVAVAQAVKGQ